MPPRPRAKFCSSCPFETPDCLRSREARGPLFLRRAGHALTAGLRATPSTAGTPPVDRQRHGRQRGTESTRPSRQSNLKVQDEEQGESPARKIAGIWRTDAPGFIAPLFAGVFAATLLFRWLVPSL